MNKNCIALLISLFLFTGCSCKTSMMPDVQVAEPYDQYLHCQQLVYSINEAEFGLKNVAERCASPHIFAKFIACTAEVKRNAAKNEYILWNRIDYLKTLYKLKKCNLGMVNSSIENQASFIGTKGSNLSEKSSTIEGITKQSQDKKTRPSCKNCKTINADLPNN